MSYQKRVRNLRYKPFYKQWLLDNGVEVYLDYVPTSTLSCDSLQKYWNDYVYCKIVQNGKERKPCPNTKNHPKGMIGECTYYQISLSRKGQTSIGIPLHRIIYVWFYGVIEPYNENNEKMEICHNQRFTDVWLDNHISNLRLDTAKANRAERKGAKNQYWKK